jgi:hypothetical protein
MFAASSCRSSGCTWLLLFTPVCGIVPWGSGEFTDLLCSSILWQAPIQVRCYSSDLISVSRKESCKESLMGNALCIHIHWHVQPHRKACQQYLHGPWLILVAIVYAALIAVCLSSKLARSFGYLIDFRWCLFNQVLPLFQGLNWDVAWWGCWRTFYCAE